MYLCYRLSFGLHCGWAVEGAVGSEFKGSNFKFWKHFLSIKLYVQIFIFWNSFLNDCIFVYSESSVSVAECQHYKTVHFLIRYEQHFSIISRKLWLKVCIDVFFCATDCVKVRIITVSASYCRRKWLKTCLMKWVMNAALYTNFFWHVNFLHYNLKKKMQMFSIILVAFCFELFPVVFACFVLDW